MNNDLFVSPLVGNKNDDPSSKVVLTKDAQNVAELNKIPLYETSAKDNVNVDDMFIAITKMVLATKREQQHKQSNDNGIKVGTKSYTNKKDNRKCC